MNLWIFILTQLILFTYENGSCYGVTLQWRVMCIVHKSYQFLQISSEFQCFEVLVPTLITQTVINYPNIAYAIQKVVEHKYIFSDPRKVPPVRWVCALKVPGVHASTGKSLKNALQYVDSKRIKTFLFEICC